jgi:hypothetical protein
MSEDWKQRAEAAEAALAKEQAENARVAGLYTADWERANTAEAALALRNYTDEDYHSLHRAHCHTAEQLAEAQSQLREMGEALKAIVDGTEDEAYAIARAALASQTGAKGTEIGPVAKRRMG